MNDELEQEKFKAAYVDALKEEFVVHDGIVFFKDDSVSDVNKPTGVMHSAFGLLYAEWNSLKPKEKLDSIQVTNKADEVFFAIPNMEIVPAELLQLTCSKEQSLPILENTLIPTMISERIKQPGARVLLTGAIAPNSVFALLNNLNDIGFTGELVVFDIDDAPMNLGKNIAEKIYTPDTCSRLKFIPGQDIRTVDARDPNLNNFSLVISDVLGHYLPEHDYLDAFRYIQQHCLANPADGQSYGGIHLFRDMGESYNTSVKGKDRIVGLEDDDIKNFMSWVQDIFGETLSELAILDFLNNRFTDPNHGPRGEYLEDMLDGAVPAHLVKTIAMINTVSLPQLETLERIFPIVIFTKTRLKPVLRWNSDNFVCTTLI